MKRHTITGMLLLLLLPLWTAGQGIEFRDMPLEKALETAAKEKKMVFSSTSTPHGAARAKR